jgi:DNA (cytosine-5)-methyltransferase 1
MTKLYSQKAKIAINQLCENGQISSLSRFLNDDNGKIIRFLSPTFAWTEKPTPKSVKINLTYNLNNSCWTISAGINEIEKWTDEEQFIIDVNPSCGYDEWVLGTNAVRLCAKDLDTRVFTSLWKAFEEKLNEVTGKADLVQLSGYYQYNARISGVMTFSSKLKIESFWRVVQCVTRCIGIATQLSAIELAQKWGVKSENVFSYLQSLRTMGYEVRNHKTNSQIPEGKYLIPYAFPTLNPKSVQLRKSL